MTKKTNSMMVSGNVVHAICATPELAKKLSKALNARFAVFAQVINEDEVNARTAAVTDEAVSKVATFVEGWNAALS